MRNLEQGHTTLGPLASIEGHTRDGQRYTLEIAKVKTGPDGVVYSCLLFSNTPDLVHDEHGKLDLVYPGKTQKLATPSQATRSALDTTYTALHEGRSPGSYWLDEPRTGGHLARTILTIDAASYVKETREETLHLYRHPIELSENEKPTLAITKNQELWFRNQDSVLVTERGIEDMPSDKIQRSGDSRMNPFTQENIQRAAMSSFLAGGAGLLWVLGVNYVVEMLPAAAQPVMQGYSGAAIKAGVGIVAAVGVDSMVPPEYRPVAAGIGVGGIIGGGMQAFDVYKNTPPTFATAADYDAWHALHPGVVIVQVRPGGPATTTTPPAGVGNRPPFGQQWSGVGRPVANQGQRFGRTG